MSVSPALPRPPFFPSPHFPEIYDSDSSDLTSGIHVAPPQYKTRRTPFVFSRRIFRTVNVMRCIGGQNRRASSGPYRSFSNAGVTFLIAIG